VSIEIQRLLEYEFLRAAEIAALRSIPWIGKGDDETADAAARHVNVERDLQRKTIHVRSATRETLV
jgi:fructose-1,6-bisphosphatase/sedoheptulose 1,7-bisphosphatase-like protein